MIYQVFREMVSKAMLRMQQIQKDPTIGAAYNAVPLGNVEFWITDEGELCYSIPAHQWDASAISDDLSRWL